jgi:hypothetical protein
MRSFFGCADPAVEERAMTQVRLGYGSDETATWIRRVLRGEVRPGAFDVEPPSLISAVGWLAHLDQEHLDTAFESWSPQHVAWAGTVSTGLDLDDNEQLDLDVLLKCVVVERPIFGVDQGGLDPDAEGVRYGFLKRAEIGRLLAYRRRFPQLANPFGDDNYPAELFDWLREIHDAGLDCWVLHG